MNDGLEKSAIVKAVEALMYEHFCNEPFHNLNLLYDPEPQFRIPGGTCSDKTLSFLKDAREAGFDAALHSGFIGGKEIHRLIRLNIDGCLYFADVGNGWPLLKLFPADCEAEYRCFGMGFRTEIHCSRISVFHEKLGKESLQLDIALQPRPESEIFADIEARYTSGIVYPFSNSIRFSLITDDRFLFLRGNRLEIYSEFGFEALEGIEECAVPSIVQQYFGYDITALFRAREKKEPSQCKGYVEPAKPMSGERQKWGNNLPSNIFW
jgi:hypothetical protein